MTLSLRRSMNAIKRFGSAYAHLWRETTTRENTQGLQPGRTSTTPSRTGCGKTYLGCVLATQACRHGLSVRYFRISRLLDALSIAHGDGRFAKLIAQLAKTDLLILDDWGLEKMTLSQRNDLLEIMEDRHGLKSTLITSQLPIAQWHKAIGDATLAEAILDRLLHNSHKLKLKGESMRNIISKMTESDHSQ